MKDPLQMHRIREEDPEMQSAMLLCMLTHFSCFQLFATSWTRACQAPPSMEFFWQEYLTGLPFPTPGDLPDPGIEPETLVLPAWQADSFLLSHKGSPNVQSARQQSDDLLSLVYVNKFLKSQILKENNYVFNSVPLLHVQTALQMKCMEVKYLLE